MPKLSRFNLSYMYPILYYTTFISCMYPFLYYHIYYKLIRQICQSSKPGRGWPSLAHLGRLSIVSTACPDGPKHFSEASSFSEIVSDSTSLNQAHGREARRPPARQGLGSGD